MSVIGNILRGAASGARAAQSANSAMRDAAAARFLLRNGRSDDAAREPEKMGREREEARTPEQMLDAVTSLPEAGIRQTPEQGETETDAPGTRQEVIVTEIEAPDQPARKA